MTSPTDDCIIWPHAKNPRSGYGMKRVGARMVGAHRYVWEQAHGPILEGVVIRHRCDNPPCVNLDHLVPGTQQDNVDDMVERRRHWAQTATHFKCGHERAQPNMKVTNKARRWVECRTCFNERMREINRKARARRKANAAIACHADEAE